jgi:hypothetical protein
VVLVTLRWSGDHRRFGVKPAHGTAQRIDEGTFDLVHDL